MSKFVTLVLEPRFNDEYGGYVNFPVFNAHGDVVGYTGGKVPETGNPCKFYVMDEEGFPVCHSASENAKMVMKLNAEHIVRQNVERENAKLREDNDRLIQAIEDLHDVSLEDKLVQLENENDKLREQLADMPKCAECEAMFKCEDCEAMLDCDECLRADASQKERKRLDYENAKLRELVSGIGHLLFSLDVDYCAACPRDGVNHPCPVHTACGGECLYKTDLRELGVEP